MSLPLLAGAFLAVLAGLFSGPLGRVHKQGQAVVWSIVGWGASVAGFGLVVEELFGVGWYVCWGFGGAGLWCFGFEFVFDLWLEGGLVVAISPSPALDGVLAGLRGLSLLRQVAAIHGRRPGAAVTLALLRRLAWIAASTSGVDLLSHSLAESALERLAAGETSLAEVLRAVHQ